MLRDGAHTCAAQTHPHKHIFQHGVSTRALRAVAVSQPFPCPPTSGALKGQESQVGGAQAKWLRPPRAVCPTSFNEMDSGSRSRTACRALPYLMQGCVCVCVCVCVAGVGGVCVCVCVCACGWGRGKWGDTACTRAGMALHYFTHPLSERAFILHILSLWKLRLGEFNSHN